MIEEISIMRSGVTDKVKATVSNSTPRKVILVEGDAALATDSSIPQSFKTEASLSNAS